MKRLWIGIFIFAIMLAGGVAMLLFSNSFYGEFSEALDAAAAAALDENWAEAEKFVRQADAQWSRYRRLFAACTDHEPIENVQLLLEKLRLYRDARLPVDFADTCRALIQLCQAIDETHSLHWWSVL